MSKPIIHFAHANGFPAETYRKFFSLLSTDYSIGYVSMHGHQPVYPVTENWSELVKELINYITQNYNQPVIGVGHSLGGILTFMAAVQRPELFRCIVMLDAPVPTYLRSKAIQWAKRWGWINKITPAERTKFRRTEWSTVEEAVAYFRTKPLFKNFDSDCLLDYVRYGTLLTEHGIRLRFDPSIEYRIYCTLPHHLPDYRGRLTMPAALLYGRDSQIMKPVDMNYMKRHFQIQVVSTTGGHLFPFEYPEVSAMMLKKIIQHFYD